MNKNKYIIVLSIKVIILNKCNQHINIQRQVAKGEESIKFSFILSEKKILL